MPTDKSAQPSPDQIKPSPIFQVGSALEAESYFKSPYYQDSYYFPFNPDPLCRGNSYKVYEEMADDDAVKVALSFKKDIVVNSGWKLDCPYPPAVEFLTKTLERMQEDGSMQMSFEDSIRDELSSYEFGFSLAEPVFRIKEGMYALDSLRVRPPQSFRFVVDEKGNVVEVKQSTRRGELGFDPALFVHHVYQPQYGNPYGKSDLRAAHTAWKAKKFVTKFHAIYLERFASPTPVARYPRNWDENEIAKLQTVLKSIQQTTSLAVQEGTLLEFIQANRDSSETYIKALDYYNMHIARALLVPDLLGISGDKTSGGSFALGQDQFKMFLASIEKDRKSLARKLTLRVIKPLVQANFGPGIECEFKFVEYSMDDRQELLKIWSDVVKGKVYKPNPEEINYFRREIKFPEGVVVDIAPDPVLPPGMPGQEPAPRNPGEPPKKEPKAPESQPPAEQAAPPAHSPAPQTDMPPPLSQPSMIQPGPTGGLSWYPEGWDWTAPQYQFSRKSEVARRIRFQGLPINIEQDTGSTRTGTDEDGNPWSVTYKVPYGEIAVTEGEDGDPVDCYLGPNQDAEHVFVVHQLKMNGRFDEDKVMLGFDTAEAAERCYRDHGPAWGFGRMDTMTMQTFMSGYLAANRAMSARKPRVLTLTRKMTSAERKVDFAAIESSITKSQEDLGRRLKRAAKQMWRDLLSQVKDSNLLARFDPARMNDLKPRFVRDFNMELKGGFRDLLEKAQAEAKRELFPDKKFALDDGELELDDMIEMLDAEAFKISGEAASLISKKVSTTIFQGLKQSMPTEEIFAMLRQQLPEATDTWLNTLIRTKTTEIYNRGRKSYFDNDPLAQSVVEAYQFSAIMDNRTSEVCSSLDKKIFSADDANINLLTPPLHFNCRSVIVPVTKFEKDALDEVEDAPDRAALQDLGAGLV